MTIQKARSIRKILVPTDFSENAANAARFAVELGRNMASSVVLYHACRVPVLASNEMMIAASNTDLERESKDRLRQFADRLQSETGYLNIDVRISSGFAVDEIKELVEHEDFDLVVMGTKGATRLQSMLIGSNTADVISHCHCPVLAVPEDAGLYRPPVSSSRRITRTTIFRRSICLRTCSVPSIRRSWSCMWKKPT